MTDLTEETNSMQGEVHKLSKNKNNFLYLEGMEVSTVDTNCDQGWDFFDVRNQL